MDHNYALQNHTAERYLLEELPQDEREAYEEHFFSCRLCAEEVQAASEFIDGARELIQNQVKEELYGHAKQHSIWGSWLNWRSIMQPLPAMACLLLVFVSGFSAYQNRVTIPQLRASVGAAPAQGTLMAQVIPPKAIVLSEARGANGPVITTSKDKAFTVQFDVTLTGFDSFEAFITTPSGVKRLPTRIISAQEATDPIQMLVPAGALETGSYIVVIQGVTSKGTESGIKGEPIHYPFQLKIQD